MKELGKRSIKMEALLIIGALAAGAHYMTKDDDPVPNIRLDVVRPPKKFLILGQTIPEQKFGSN